MLRPKPTQITLKADDLEEYLVTKKGKPSKETQPPKTTAERIGLTKQTSEK